MRRALPLLLAGLLLGAAAEPGLSPPPGARLPPGLATRDEAGRATTIGAALGGHPVVFTFADYGCTVLCGTALGLVAAVLPETGLRPGRDYGLLVLGLDPKDGPSEAAAMRRAYLGDGSAMAAAARFLVADGPVIAEAEARLGYRAEYDPAQDRFDHPLALMVLAPDGRLTAVLPGLGAQPAALREALLAATASDVAPGPLAQGVRLLCAGLGQVAADGPGAVVLRVATAVGAAAGLGLLGLGALLLLRRRERGA